MENHNFENGEYLCILGSDGGSEGDYDCYSCNSAEEVFRVLTDRIMEEIDYLTSEADWPTMYSNSEDAMAFVDMVRSLGVIRNPEIITQCYDYFFADSWWFTVLDSYGSVWFCRER